MRGEERGPAGRGVVVGDTDNCSVVNAAEGKRPAVDCSKRTLDRAKR